MKQFLRNIGEKLREWFGPEEYADDDPRKYLSTNANGKIYVSNIEKYLEAGNCFEEMERTAEVLKKDV